MVGEKGEEMGIREEHLPNLCESIWNRKTN
jgi:hypothetical protein